MTKLKTEVIALLLCCFVSYSKTQSIQRCHCINILQCRPIINALSSRTISSNLRLQLQQYFCGKEGQITKVCCPDSLSLLPTENCGQAEALERITNGNRAELLEFPWQAALKYVSKKSLPYNCGGSLINKRYVLTAAHCITTKLIGVRLGEYDFSTPVDCVSVRGNTTCAPPHQDFAVTKADATIHPQYRDATSGFDIALIRLPRDAVYNKAVKPVCLPITNSLAPKSLKNLLITGWGRTELDQPSSVLLKAAVPYEENSVCMKQLPVQIFDSQLCTKLDRGKDSCNGDSGGPITTVVNDNFVVKTVQVGLVSYGPSRCGEQFPGIYTRLSSYIKWITDNVKP